MITWYANKTFISIFTRAQFFMIQGSFLLMYKQELKSGKVTNFFSKLTNLWRKIFISRHKMIIFIYKSWSVNSGWLTLFVCSKVTRGDSFASKMLLTISSLQEQRFNKYIVDSLLKKWNLQLFFRGQKCITVTIDFTNKEFVS